MGAAQIAPGPTPTSHKTSVQIAPVALGGAPGGVSGALKRAATKAHLDKVVPNKQVRSERFLGLNGARLLASIHIVIGHAYQLTGFLDPAITPYFYSWGFTWVPWFFMLSGFVLCHARLHKKGNPHKKEEVLPTLRKRLAFIYPLYACGLVLDLLTLYWRDIRLPEWWAVLSQAFLCQSFVPWLPEAGVQAQCWFLSAMVPYWLSFDFVFRRLIIEVTRLRTCCVLLLLLSLPPWLYYAIAAETNPTWYSAHEWEQVDTPTDIGVILLKFNPICYFHVFLFGMVLARLRFLVSDALSRAAAHVKAELSFARSVERLLRFGVSLAYLGLLLVFNVPAIQPISWKLSARLSVLMLLQGLLIAGLAPVRREHVRVSGRAVDRLYDPVAELLSFSPPAWGHLSYAQYVLHMILMTALWPADMLSQNWELFLFFVLLLAWSYLAANLVTVPAARWWNRRSPVQLFCVACTVAAVVCGMTAIDKSNRDNAAAVASGCEEYDGSYVPLLPEAYVQIDEGAFDLRLNWTSSAALGERALINPSLLWATDPATNKTALMRAARAHAIGCTAEYVDYTDEETGIRWSEVVEVNVTWHADLALDDGVADAQDATALAAAWDGWDPAAWGLDGAADLQPLAIHKGDAGSWLPLCQSAVSWDNGTEIRRTTVLGAEDPKLTAFPEAFGAGAASVTFTSLPPDSWADPSCGYYKQLSDEDGVVYIEVLGDNKTSDAVKQGYQTVGALAAGADGAYTAEVAHIGCGELQSDEKNWIAFTDGDNLHYVYSVYPHSIYTVAADGSCRPQQYLTSNDAWGGSAAAYERLAALAEGGDLEFHGSGAAVPWDDGYMALFHTKYVEGNRSGAYVSFVYTFSGSPPFPITNVSRPLPLSAGNASFASSLSIAPGGSKLVVGYGAADAEARAFVMSTDYLRALFDWGVACTQPPPPPPPPLAPFPAEEWEYPLFKNESACLWPRLNNCSRQDRSVVAGYVAPPVAHEAAPVI